MSTRESILERKYQALDDFISRAKRSAVGRDIAKLILYGSVLRGEATPESDIDLLVIATGDVRAIRRALSDIAFDVMLDRGELVSPMVYCLDALRYPPSYFAYRAIQQGKEVHTVDEGTLRRAESLGYLELAIEYREQSQKALECGSYRLAIDGAYNAAELCVKGLLLLQIEDLPSSHGGLIQRFSEVWVKTGLLPGEMGRRLHKGFELRNQARYERHATFGEGDAQIMLALANQFIAALSTELGYKP